MRRYSHKPPKAAVNALRKAAEAQRKGDVAEWEKYLRQSVTIDPDYFEARNNFGAFLARNLRAVEIGRFMVELRVAPSQPFRYLTVRLEQASPERLTVTEI